MEKNRPGRPVTNPLRKERITEKMLHALRILASGQTLSYNHGKAARQGYTLATVMALQRRGMVSQALELTDQGRRFVEINQNYP